MDSKAISWVTLAAFLFGLGTSSCNRYFSRKNDPTKVEQEIQTKKIGELEALVRTINYHYNAALEGKEIILTCPPEFENFKICLIDGAYCIAEKKFDFAIKNFEQALIECEKIEQEHSKGVLYYFLGLSYESNNMTAKAKESYEKSIEFNKKEGYQKGVEAAGEALKNLDIR